MTSTDPLLQPTLQQTGRGPAPWRLSSQGYVAFFGGSLAGTAVAVANALRLGLPRRTVLGVAAIGAAGLAATAALALVVGGAELGLLRLVPVAAYLGQARLQRDRNRAFVLRGGRHASLLGVGIAAVLGLGLLEVVAIDAMVEAVR
ncbi:hypothetical protein [Peterkaempfera griseoplana]|uniref:hypothetical protein n=1 Tax=Peterkaempfera griseoplana TaxID=66896 RepID=UPI0006E2BA4B|nr:hypothetical protein [Peterkaempfera griseoplana]